VWTADDAPAAAVPPSPQPPRPAGARALEARVRPVLLPALRRLWRDRETLQLGRPPGPAAVLVGVDPATRAALALLDGTRDAAQVVREASVLGCPPDRTSGLLSLLDEAGLLSDAAAPTGLDRLPRAERDRLAADVADLRLGRGDATGSALQRRRGARVRVVGAGRVGAPLAALLAASGLGAVDVDDAGLARPVDTGPGGLLLADLGRPRGDAIRGRLRELAPSLDISPGPAGFVVLAPPDGVTGTTDAGAVGGAHLLAEVRDGTGVVGPLVVPGASACLHCLELTRSDLDPDWPALATQLSAPAEAVGSGVLAVAVAAQAAAQVLAVVDGWPAPAALDGTLELRPPDWRWRRRSWQPHPDCGCVRLAG